MRELPNGMLTALRARKLLIVWADVSVPLSEREPPNRVVAINQWIEQAQNLPAIATPLSELPPLAILSLDPTARVERAFKAAGVTLRVVKTKDDVPARAAHNLLKLGGDLASRTGVVLSREGMHDLLSDADKRYLLDEARHIADDGVVIVVGADTDSTDFQAWWRVLQPALGATNIFTLGEAFADVPQLTIGFNTLINELKAVTMTEQSESKTASSRSGGVNINSGKADIGGDVTGRDKIVSAGGHIINAGRGATVIIGTSGREETTPSPGPSTEHTLTDPGETVDVAILTVLPEEYEAVCSQFASLRPPAGDAANIYAWQIGEVTCPRLGGAYAIGIGMMGRAGTPLSALAAVDAIQRWKPRYVFFVGVAGGLAGLNKGDVVIADVIYGYEYGKIEQVFTPRDNWTYKTDLGLLTGATAYALRPDWRERITAQPPVESTPKAITGEVGSGDKVIDDPTNAFYAEVLKRWPKTKAVEMEGAGVGAAIEQAQALGIPVGFMMIRGISDLPRPKQADETRGTIERDNWKPYASATAAAFAVGLIGHGLPERPRSTTSWHAEPSVSVSSEAIASLQRQWRESCENLRLIEERKAEFVLGVDIPLQLLKEERRLKERIAELERQLGLS